MTDRRSRARTARFRACCAAALALGSLHAVAVAPASAQRVEPGDSVRFKLTGAIRMEALAIRLDDETLFVRAEGIPGEWPVLRSNLDELAVLRMRTPQEAFRRGFGAGMVAGLFVGAGVGLLLHATDAVGSADDPPAELLVHTTLRFAGLGAIAGGFTGGFLGSRSPGFGWVAIRLPTS